MSIDIGAAFSDGIDEFLSKKGVVLAGVFFVVNLLNSLTVGSVLLALANAIEGTPDASPAVIRQLRAQAQFGLDIGMGRAIVVFVAFLLAAEFARIVAIRSLADTNTDSLLPRHYTGNLLTLFVYRIIVGVILFILYGVLALLALAPGVMFAPLALLTVPVLIYVAIGLYFAPIAVVVDEIGPLDAIARAWEYAKDNRLKLVAIAIGVAVISFIITAPNLLFSGVTAANETGLTAITRSPVAVIVSGVFGSLSTVFTLSIATSTYLQLASANEPPEGGAASSDQFTTETQF
jgi:hypothetical protein